MKCQLSFRKRRRVWSVVFSQGQTIEITGSTDNRHFCLRLTLIVEKLQYKLKRWSKKECCKQCRYVKFKGTMAK